MEPNEKMDAIEEEETTAPEAQGEEESSAEYEDFDDVDLTFLQPKEEKQAVLAEVDAEAVSEKEEKKPEVVEEKPVIAQQVQEQQPAQQPPQQPTQQQAQETVTPEAGRIAAEEAERVTLEKISEFFTLSDDEKDELNVDPAKVMPRLAARVMLRTVQTSVAAIQALLPQVIEQHQQSQTRSNAAMDEFYTSWPQLKEREDAKQLIGQYANLYRQQNPNASQGDAIKAVGASVMVALGLQAQGNNQPTPGAGAVQPAGNGTAQMRRESLPPHRPAAATTLRELAPPKPDNIFEQMLLDPDD